MTQASRNQTVGMRILLVAVLFSAYIVMDNNNIEFFSLNADKIYTYITKNSMPNLFAFIREITYTFTHG